ncbi:hypothetical protein G9A89_018276 [Geosiphon pyriformis]|nr:hypothetical protein G9A89_018276 [Geosiphon pyriformis]
MIGETLASKEYISIPVRQINLIGHGYGGVYATLLAVKLTKNGYSVPLQVVTFGTPRIGSSGFADYLDFLDNPYHKVKIFRVTIGNDFVPRLPIRNLRDGRQIFKHSSREFWIDLNCDCRFNAKESGSGSIGEQVRTDTQSLKVYFCQGPFSNIKIKAFTENQVILSVIGALKV